MRFSVIASAALLLTPLVAAQFAVRAPNPDTTDVSARDVADLNKRDVNQLEARTPPLTQQQVAQHQDHIKAQIMVYNQHAKDLNWYHNNKGTHAQLADTHAKLASTAQE